MLYRPLLASEIPEAADVFLITLSDMARRNGLSPPAGATAKAIEPVFAHLVHTGLFRVAEVDGRIAGICSAVVRDSHWYLSMFWVLPELQNQKIGGPLLRQVWDEGRARGAHAKFTWASPDFTAVSMYMRLGLLPGSQMFAFSGTSRSDGLASLTAGYTSSPLEASTANKVDAWVLGVERAVDHAFWSRQSGAVAQQLFAPDGSLAGYYYARGGVIGPAAWLAPEHGEALISRALLTASEQASSVKLRMPGINHVGITMALQAGLKLTAAAHLLQSTPFGRLAQYLPSGPELF
jgi:GNAT superfamily N-acetyltransferase